MVAILAAGHVIEIGQKRGVAQELSYMVGMVTMTAADSVVEIGSQSYS
jgi:hypothetical protein